MTEMIFGEVRLQRSRRRILADMKQRKNKKTGEVTETPVYENLYHPMPVGYTMEAARARIFPAFQRIANGETKKVELDLLRFPQIQTAVGEAKARFPKLNVSADYTTKEEGNTLFVIELKTK